MGFVRMMRSGSKHYISKAICFIPDLEDVISFEKLTASEGMSEICLMSAKEFDEVTNSLTSNFDRGIEYFQVTIFIIFETKKVYSLLCVSFFSKVEIFPHFTISIHRNP
jgi:hypothetical protein